MAPEKRTELIAVRLGPNELKMLTELAEADGAYQSHVIRLLIRRARAARSEETTMRTSTTLAVLIAFALGALSAAVAGVHADAPEGFDRALAERLVRAEEQQARSLDELRRAVERCSK